MKMPLGLFYRAAILATFNPLQLLLRASATTTALNQSPNLRAFSTLSAQCPSFFQSHQYHQRNQYSTSAMDPESNPKDTTNEQQDKQSNEDTPLALPEASSGIKLDVSAEGGSTVKLDHLGPLVVNQDGTVSRISNWAQMTEQEKKGTLRVLGKRNKQRLDALKAAEAAKGGK